MNKIVEIFKAWGIAYNPSDEQSELAAQRMMICDDCPYKGTIPIPYCKECGCPLQKKVFTPKVGGCRIGKWDVVDKSFNK